MKTEPAARAFAGLILSLAVSGALAGCGRSGTGAAARGGGGRSAVAVQVAAAVTEDVPRQIESIGSVQALRAVAVKSQVDGVIAEVKFREGQDVKAGDLLIVLDKRPFENGLRMAHADLTNARAEASRAEEDAKRYEKLGEQQAISKEQLAQLVTKAETTRAQAQAKEAAVANAELQLGYAEIRAPITGRTGQLLLHEGALIKANDAAQSIVTINQLTPIAVAYSIPEPSLPEVRSALTAGQVFVWVSDRNAEVERRNGRLEFVDNTVDSTTGTITLKAVFENADNALWPGQFVHVRTTVGVDRGALVVPMSAVMNGQDGSQIFVVKDDSTVELRTVQVLRAVGDRALISSGVQAGETVVSDGQLQLLPGVKVVKKTLDDLAGKVAQAAKQESP
jgi:multidrug efflux system membrane fusion protein